MRFAPRSSGQITSAFDSVGEWEINNQGMFVKLTFLRWVKNLVFGVVLLIMKNDLGCFKVGFVNREEHEKPLGLHEGA